MSSVEGVLVLTPNTDAEKRAAALWVCGHAIRVSDPGQQQTDALTVLQALGLTHDPHLVRLHPMYRTRLRKEAP